MRWIFSALGWVSTWLSFLNITHFTSETECVYVCVMIYSSKLYYPLDDLYVAMRYEIVLCVVCLCVGHTHETMCSHIWKMDHHMDSHGRLSHQLTVFDTEVTSQSSRIRLQPTKSLTQL